MTQDAEEIQGELFSQSNKLETGSLRQRLNLKSLRKFSIDLSYEHLIITCIVLIVSLGLSYTIGVEHGKQRAGHKNHNSLDLPEIIVEKPASVPIEVSPDINESFPIEAPIRVAENTAQYTIQLASYNPSAKRIADSALARLIKEGYEPILRESGKYYAICVGEYGSTRSAQDTLAKFKQTSSYHDAFLRKID